ncbi:hypothetical protein HN51_030004, partial [Arachis hypogaea]
ETKPLSDGFTKLCKDLGVVLVATHILVYLFPSSLTTIPFAKNLITTGYVGQSVYGVVISTISLLFIGKLLEPIWGSRELLKFIFVVNFLTSMCVFVTTIALYYI